MRKSLGNPCRQCDSIMMTMMMVTLISLTLPEESSKGIHWHNVYS